MDRLSESVLILTRQNKTLQEGCHLKEDGVSRSENDEFLSKAEPEEDILRRASKIQRKKARADLRSQTGGRGTPDSESLDGRLVRKKQGQPKDNIFEEIPDLKNEFLALQSKLKSAQDHIIHLGGNLGALLPSEILKDDFKSLVDATRIWIMTYVQPTIGNSGRCLQAFECARKIQGQDAGLNLSRSRNQDFRTTSRFPGADEHVFLVMIFDLIVDKVFNAEFLYGDPQLQREIDVIKHLGDSMVQKSDSSKSLYNSRRWMSEAVTAIISRKETQNLRLEFSHTLADAIIRDIGLPTLLGHSNQAELEEAEGSIRREVIWLALELGDKMACAIDRYSLEVPPYWTEPCVFQTEFFRDLSNLDCKNFGEGPPRFRLEKMRTAFSDDEIRSQLRAICPAIPALVLTEARDRSWGPSTILVKQQVWVSWQPKRVPTPRPEERGYFWNLYHQDRMDASARKE